MLNETNITSKSAEKHGLQQEHFNSTYKAFELYDSFET